MSKSNGASRTARNFTIGELIATLLFTIGSIMFMRNAWSAEAEEDSVDNEKTLAATSIFVIATGLSAAMCIRRIYKLEMVAQQADLGEDPMPPTMSSEIIERRYAAVDLLSGFLLNTGTSMFLYNGIRVDLRDSNFDNLKLAIAASMLLLGSLFFTVNSAAVVRRHSKHIRQFATYENISHENSRDLMRFMRNLAVGGVLGGLAFMTGSILFFLAAIQTMHEHDTATNRVSVAGPLFFIGGGCYAIFSNTVMAVRHQLKLRSSRDGYEVLNGDNHVRSR